MEYDFRQHSWYGDKEAPIHNYSEYDKWQLVRMMIGSLKAISPRLKNKLEWFARYNEAERTIILYIRDLDLDWYNLNEPYKNQALHNALTHIHQIRNKYFYYPPFNFTERR